MSSVPTVPWLDLKIEGQTEISYLTPKTGLKARENLLKIATFYYQFLYIHTYIRTYMRTFIHAYTKYAYKIKKRHKQNTPQATTTTRRKKMEEEENEKQQQQQQQRS